MDVVEVVAQSKRHEECEAGEEGREASEDGEGVHEQPLLLESHQPARKVCMRSSRRASEWWWSVSIGLLVVFVWRW